MQWLVRTRTVGLFAMHNLRHLILEAPRRLAPTRVLRGPYEHATSVRVHLLKRGHQGVTLSRSWSRAANLRACSPGNFAPICSPALSERFRDVLVRGGDN